MSDECEECHGYGWVPLMPNGLVPESRPCHCSSGAEAPGATTNPDVCDDCGDVMREGTVRSLLCEGCGAFETELPSADPLSDRDRTEGENAEQELCNLLADARIELDALKARIEEVAEKQQARAGEEIEASRKLIGFHEGACRGRAAAYASVGAELRSLLNPTQTEPEAESIEEIIPGTKSGLASVSVRGNQ